jgi:alpha/beta superfamily hydrolase
LGVTDDSVSPIQVHTTDGEVLEAELFAPATASLAVVITHPHPTYGGNMHTPVPDALFRQCLKDQVPALRFNFRGVGGSSGTHEKGIGEQQDVLGAVALLSEQYRCPVVLAGWSFGADVALAVDDDAVAGWLAVAAPLSVIEPDTMAAATAIKPKLLLVPDHDQFRPPASANQATEDWRNCRLQPVPGADHFLAGSLHVVAEALHGFVDEMANQSQSPHR